MARCKSCDQTIVWVWLDDGVARSMAPLDATRSPNGTYPTEADNGNVIAEGRTVDGRQVFHVARRGEDAPGPRFLTHFATCPHAASHRKKRRRA